MNESGADRRGGGPGGGAAHKPSLYWNSPQRMARWFASEEYRKEQEESQKRASEGRGHPRRWGRKVLEFLVRVVVITAITYPPLRLFGPSRARGAVVYLIFFLGFLVGLKLLDWAGFTAWANPKKERA